MNFFEEIEDDKSIQNINNMNNDDDINRRISRNIVGGSVKYGSNKEVRKKKYNN